MQQQQINNIPNAPVHIKVAYENEFRRFLLSPISYEHLYARLKTLFNLQSAFSIKFQDDENDWVLIMTDQELVYATELSGNPLRLQIKLVDSAPSTPTTENVERPWRGRGCGGRGRGWAGRGGVKFSPEERLQKKSSRLTERIDWLETKLKSEELSSERERVLRWKLTKLQEKLAAVKAFQANVLPTEVKSEGPVTATSDAPANATDEMKEDPEEPSWRGCRRGRGCGRGGMRRAMMEGGACGEHPCRKGRARLDPELIAKFRQAKANLHAARESGNAEEIQTCLEAFKAAKAAKWEARVALRAQEDAPVSKDEETKA